MSSPRDESLLFRQKEPKPFLPVRGPTGSFASVPNQDGSGTRSEVKSHLSAQTALAERPIRYGGEASPNAGAQLVTEKRGQTAFLNIPKKGKVWGQVRVRGQFSHSYIFSMASHWAPREVTGKSSHKNSIVTVQPCLAKCTVSRNVKADPQTQAGMVLDPASAWDPVRMNKKGNPNIQTPVHYIRREDEDYYKVLLHIGSTYVPVSDEDVAELKKQSAILGDKFLEFIAMVGF